MKKNTMPSVCVKTILLNDTMLAAGKDYKGVLRLYVSNDEHVFDNKQLVFVETLPPTAGKRNPHVFEGKYITVTRRDDGSLRLNFKDVKIEKGINIVVFAFDVANELIKALKGLVEEKAVD